MRCRSCGHDLKAVTSNRCSECGTFFDPCHPRTYLTEPASGLRPLKQAIAAFVLILMAVGSHEFILSKPPIEWWVVAIASLQLIGMLGGLGFLSVAIRDSGRALLGKEPWQIHAGYNLIALAIAAVTVVLFVGYVLVVR